MSVLSVKPKFLYPISRKFPFDEVAEEIVRALEKRNWNVPGIKVEFHIYGSGEAKYKHVYEIVGENFKLHFSRAQGKLDSIYRDISALNRIYIPKQIMEVYSDESGPTYYLYVGKNWCKDKKWFMNSTKVHSKLDKKPRRYLKYRGNLVNTRSTKLISDTDLDREYSPIGDEPVSINLQEKFEEITQWLELNVLSYILTFPESEKIVEEEIQLIPYEGPWSIVYSICNNRDKERVITGKRNPNELSPEQRYVYFGSGRRLVPLASKGKYPKIANEGFVWCDVNQNITIDSEVNDIAQYIKSQMYDMFGKNHIVAIKPKYANDVYVADNAIYEDTRHKLFEAIAPREILTDEEVDQALAERGSTIVPITKYMGNYKQPILLFARELDFDEILWITEDN